MSEYDDQELDAISTSRTTPVMPLSEGGSNDRASGNAGGAALPGDAEPTADGKAGAAGQHPITDRQPRIERPPQPALGPSHQASTSGPGSDDTQIPPGTMLAGRYCIVRRLGRGGMGEVYCAEDTEPKQHVALKLLPEKYAQDLDRIDRLRQEVRLARSIAHPNVCRVYDIAQAQGLPFLSMELIDGEDLDKLLRRVDHVPLDRAVEIGIQICRALDAIHGAGILHRDLKPANIMLDTRGLVRIADFGLASLAERVTEQSGLQGTPAYMAPEQLGAREASIQSDLYALGLILHKLLTGRPAFDARTPLALYTMRSEAAPPPPSTLVKGIPPAIDAIITRCLAPDPRARPASAREVEAALAAMTPGQPATLVVAVASTAPDRAALAAQLGDEDTVTRVMQAHAQTLDELCRQHGGTRVRGTSEADAAVVLFAHPGDAVRHALAHQRAARALAQREGVALSIGVGMHLGVRPRAALDTSGETEDMIELRDEPHDGQHDGPRDGPRDGNDIDRVTRELATRLAKVAGPGQILLTRTLFDLARQDAQPAPDRLQWLAHGSYELAGMAEPVDVCEVGVEGLAPLAPPADSELAQRRRVQEAITGWRPAPGTELPEHLGRPHWRMERKLGQGGFGEVWLAEHAKTRERRVFKFCYDADKLRALQREITLFRLLKQALGNRADIVPIHDWSFDQAPYFIESAYTAGGNLGEWAAAQGGLSAIPLDARLAIVAQVATALAAAHSVGVLHKDVKPGNVLMTRGDGSAHAQLGDFGIGALTERERLAEAGITALGLTADARTNLAATPDGTRLYMAPELLEGKPATTQADIYALGVMLYQIVAGDFTRALAPGWERDIDDELLRADIAAAVDRDPARRLGSAAQLAERLETLEQRRAELAARERERQAAEQAQAALARVRKRRKALTLAAAVLVLFAGTVTLQSLRLAQKAREAERNLRDAELERSKAEQVSGFLVELFEEADPYTAQGREVTAREILDRGKSKIDALADQPEVQATLMHVMGVVYGNIGLYQDSVTLLEGTVEKRRQIHGSSHLAVADSLHALAKTLERQQAFASAERVARDALALRRAHLGDEHLDTVATLEGLGDALVGLGRFEEARPLYETVLSVRRQLLGPEHTLVAQALRGTGRVYQELTQYQMGKQLLQEALDMFQRLPGVHEAEIAKTMYFLGVAHFYSGGLAAAEALIVKSLASNRKLLGNKHPLVIEIMNRLGQLFRRSGRYEEAEVLLRELQEQYRGSMGETSPAYAELLKELALLARVRGDCKKANKLSQQSVALYRQVFPGDHWLIALGLDIQAYLLESWGALSAAEDHYREALEIFRRLPDQSDPYLAVIMANLAHLYVKRGDLAQAGPLLEQAAEEVQRRQSSPESRWTLEYVQSARGEYASKRGDRASAERLLLDSFNWLQQHYGLHRLYTQRALERIAAFYESGDHSAKAHEYRVLIDNTACATRMQSAPE